MATLRDLYNRWKPIAQQKLQQAENFVQPNNVIQRNVNVAQNIARPVQQFAQRQIQRPIVQANLHPIQTLKAGYNSQPKMEGLVATKLRYNINPMTNEPVQLKPLAQKISNWQPKNKVAKFAYNLINDPEYNKNAQQSIVAANKGIATPEQQKTAKIAAMNATLDTGGFTAGLAKNVGKGGKIVSKIAPLSNEANHPLENKAIKNFFETKNPNEALYITSDGRMVDGTGKSQVGQSDWKYMTDRTVDHREVAQDVTGKSGSDALIEYMNKTKSVRMSVANNGTELNLDVVQRPTDSQLASIEKMMSGGKIKTIVADVSNSKGGVDASGDFTNFRDYKNFLDKNRPALSPTNLSNEAKPENWARVQGQTKGLTEAGKKMTIANEASRKFVVNEPDSEYLLTHAGANPTEVASGKITVYRATENGKILPGDFVTPDKKVLEPYIGQRIETGRNPKIIKQIVDIKDLRIGDEPTDFVYSPQSTQGATTPKLKVLPPKATPTPLTTEKATVGLTTGVSQGGKGIVKRPLTENQSELARTKDYLKNLVDTEAIRLRNLEKEQGVSLKRNIAEYGQDTFTRISSHSQEYSDFYKKNGHAPGLGWWKEKVLNDFESGRNELAGEYQSVKEFANTLEQQVAKEGGRIPVQDLSGKAQRIKVKVFPQNVKIKDLSPDIKNIKVKYPAISDVAPESIKDISGLEASFKSVYRNFEKAFGKSFGDVKRRILDPFDASKGNMVRENERLATELKSAVVDGLGIKKGSKESALVQLYGEGKVTPSELKTLAGKKTQDIINADSWFRSKYNQLLDEVNAVRKQIYPNNPNKQIPKRQDYYRHFQELTGIEGLKNVFDQPSGIPTEMSAISYQTKPSAKFLSFSQRRKGDQTKYDAVGGFIDYMRSATYAKNIDPHIVKFRNLAGELVDASKVEGQENVGSRLTQYINQFADDLSGKTNPGDRWLQDTFGRGTMKGINWLNSRVKANVILGNLSSAVAQAGNTPQMMAKSGYRNWAGGFKDVLTPGNRAIDGSDFIKERYSNSLFDQFDTKLLDQPKKAAVWITQSLDELATKIGWNGFYRQAVQKGVSNPIKYADDLTREMVGGRGIGEVPLAQKAKATQLVAPFMLEVQNLMQVLGKEAKNKEIGVLLKYALAAYGFNRAAEAVRGSGVTFDPIQAVIEATKAYQEEDNKKVGAMRAGGRLAGEYLSNTMGGQQLAQLYPEYGVKIGGETVTRKELFGKKDPTRFGSGLITSATQNPLYKVLPPFGGSQLEKTITGAKAYAKGYVENKGKEIQYQVDQTPANLAKSLAFGKYATSNAREYFDKNRTALSEKQSGIYKTVGDKTDYYKSVLDERAKNKEIDKIKEGNGGTTSDGTIVKKIGKEWRTFDTESEANLEIAKDDLKKSNKKSTWSGDNYLYKKTNGDVGTYTRDEYDDKLLSSKMAIYENTGANYGDWLKLANDKLTSIENQYNQADDISKLSLQNDYVDLLQKIQKYQGYGGFKKGKAGKKAKWSSIGSSKVSMPKFTGAKVSKPKKLAIKKINKPKLS